MNSNDNRQDEDSWIRDALARVAWPRPSMDLQGRIMASIDMVDVGITDIDAPIVPPSAFIMPTRRVYAWVCMAFVVAFCLGMVQNQAAPGGSVVDYSETIYYSGAGYPLLQSLGQG